MGTTRVAKHAKPPMSNSAYDALKFVAQIGLPALGTLYYTVAQIWGLAYATEVVGTITAVDFFLGAILKYSSIKYDNSDAKFDGDLVIDKTRADKNVYFFEVDPASLGDKSEITLKVKDLPPS